MVSENIDSEITIISKSFIQALYSKAIQCGKIGAQHKKSNGISCIISGQHPYHGALILLCKASIKVNKHHTPMMNTPSLPMIIPEIITNIFYKDFKQSFKI